jgi:hypothetical protein
MRLALILAAIEKSLHLLGRLRQNRPRLGHHQQQRTMLRIARLLRQTHALDRMTAEQLGATHTPPLPTIKLSLPIVAKYASAAGNGKVSEACAIMDSLGAVEQSLGHGLDFTALPLEQREPSATDKVEA